jgi:hypothetical protein
MYWTPHLTLHIKAPLAGGAISLTRFAIKPVDQLIHLKYARMPDFNERHPLFLCPPLYGGAVNPEFLAQRLGTYIFVAADLNYINHSSFLQNCTRHDLYR